MSPTIEQMLTARTNPFRYCLPYHYRKIEWRGRAHVYLPLNRNYAPLGIISSDSIEYANHLDKAVIFFRDPHDFNGVWHDPEGLYLYNDSPASRRDYFHRLERLYSHRSRLITML